MPTIEVGRVCVKIAGRDAGKFCVITRLVNDNFVEIAGPKKLSGVKRKKCNIAHLAATADKIEIRAKAKDEDVEAALKKAKLATKFKKGIKF